MLYFFIIQSTLALSATGSAESFKDALMDGPTLEQKQGSLENFIEVCMDELDESDPINRQNIRLILEKNRQRIQSLVDEGLDLKAIIKKLSKDLFELKRINQTTNAIANTKVQFGVHMTTINSVLNDLIIIYETLIFFLEELGS